MAIKIIDPTQRSPSRQGTTPDMDADPSRQFGNQTTQVVGAPRVPNVAQYYAAEGRANAALGQTVAGFASDVMEREIALRDAEERERAEQAFIDYKINVRKAEEDIEQQYAENPDFLPDDQDMRRSGMQHTFRNMALDQFDPDSEIHERLSQLLDNYDATTEFDWVETLNGRRTDIAVGQAGRRYDSALDEVTAAAKALNVTRALEEYQNFMEWGQTKGRIRAFAGPDGQARLEEAGDKLIEQYARVATRKDLSTARDTLEQLESEVAQETLRPQLGERVYDGLIEITRRAIAAHEREARSAQTQFDKFLKERSQNLRMITNSAMNRPEEFPALANALGIDPNEFPRGMNQMFLDAAISATDENGIPLLRPEDAIKLQDNYDRMEERNEIDAVLFDRYQEAIDGGFALNSNDKQDVAAADVAYESINTFMEQQGVPERQKTEQLVDLFNRTKIVPTEYVLETSSLVNSQDPDSVSVGLSRISALRLTDPELTSGFSDRQVMAAEMHARGAPVERATSILQAAPIPQEILTQRNEEFDEFDEFEDQVNDMIEERYDYAIGLFAGDDSPAAPPQMIQRFKDQARVYYQQSGDEEVAMQMAMDDVSRVWGRTDVLGDGRQRMMMFAPELKLGGDRSATAPLLRDNLKQFASQYGLSEGEYFIESDLVTANAPKGTMPSYALFQVDADGFITQVFGDNNMPVRWQPDTAEFIQTLRQRSDDADQKKRDDERERQRMINEGMSIAP